METNNLKQNNFYSVKANGIANSAIKDVSSSSRVVTGFFNSYNFLDSTGDVLLPGCAKKSIKERGVGSEATAKIKHALNHDLTQLPGKLQVLEERELDGIKGIYFESKMTDTTLGNDTLKNYLEGVYDNHSIGFRYVQMTMIEKDAHGNSKAWDTLMEQLMNPEAAKDLKCMYAVKEIELYEGSTVAFGANSLTPYLGVKSMNPQALNLALLNKVSLLSKMLKSGGQSDDMMRSFELTILQLKQIMYELCELLPKKEDIKVTTPELKSNILTHAEFNDFNI